MNKPPSRQSGASLLILMLVMMTVFATLLVANLRGRNPEDVRREQSAAAIEKARQALLAWSLSRDGTGGTGLCTGTTGRACAPVELPCPDRNALGSAEEGRSGQGINVNCNGASAATRIGRLPWKTLGIPKLVDGYGEPLWYVVDRQFAVRATATEQRRINSDSLATNQVFASNGTTNLSTNGETAAAVIFAAGPPIGAQARPNQIASNYLEASNSRNNANPTGPFIVGNLSGTFNDQLGVITGSQLIAANQQRLGQTIANVVNNYYQSTFTHPYPAQMSVAACRTNNPNSNCASQTNLCSGILPRAPASWGSAANSRPQWFLQNIWHRGVFFAVKRGTTCNTPFVIDGVSEPTIDAIFILPGAPRVSRANNLVNAANASTNLALYLDDVPNQNKWTNPTDRNFVTPSCASNDVMYTCQSGICSPRKLTLC